jgi:hypothetical protein
MAKKSIRERLEKLKTECSPTVRGSISHGNRAGRAEIPAYPLLGAYLILAFETGKGRPRCGR